VAYWELPELVHPSKFVVHVVKAMEYGAGVPAKAIPKLQKSIRETTKNSRDIFIGGTPSNSTMPNIVSLLILF
jgi:hypothetical protein